MSGGSTKILGRVFLFFVYRKVWNSPRKNDTEEVGYVLLEQREAQRSWP